MKHIYILLISIFAVNTLKASTVDDYVTGQNNTPQSEQMTQLGRGISLPSANSAFSIKGLGSKDFEDLNAASIASVLYGKIPGLNITADDSYSVHGNTPLIVVDGFQRRISDVQFSDIESITLLKDANAAAIYGLAGAHGVLLITTKRGKAEKLKTQVKYQFGVQNQTRIPVYADGYTYATYVNEALLLNNESARYNEYELDAFKNNTHPYDYPSVDWWDEVYNPLAYNHNLNFIFQGGNKNFRHYSTVDYNYGVGFVKGETTDDRYNINPYDVDLSISSYIDVNISPTTKFAINLQGTIAESNRTNLSNVTNAVAGVPSLAYPIRYENGIYGGSSLYSFSNPVGRLYDTGTKRTNSTAMLTSFILSQELDIIAKGLSFNALIGFNYRGSTYETTTKTFSSMNSNPTILSDGTLITSPETFGTDSTVLSHSSGYGSSVYQPDIDINLNYTREVGKNYFNAYAIYNQYALIYEGQNNSNKRQSLRGIFAYAYDNRYAISAVASYDGTAHMTEGDQFMFFPAVNASWTLSEENFLKSSSVVDYLKIYASYGLSGNDNIAHDLDLQSYVSGTSYRFTTNSVSYSGWTAGSLPIENLTIPKVEKVSVGIDFTTLDNRLSLYTEGFYKRNKDRLISTSVGVSSIIGISVAKVNSGVYDYWGADFGVTWQDKINDFAYSIYATGSYVDSKKVNIAEAYSPYDYTYKQGDNVWSIYGYESLGFFKDEADIADSPEQLMSSTPRPGDLKYKDQNGDNVIDDYDIVLLDGTSYEKFNFGFGFSMSYKNFELSAAFQGVTGKTVNLLNTSVYTPMYNNGNLTQNFLDTEIPWSESYADNATMPRLTTGSKGDNYENSSFWLRDGSYLKLRNLAIAYTIPKSVTKSVDLKIYCQGHNLFTMDGLKTVDPVTLDASVSSYWLGVKLNF